jgi:hypothetical protein
MVKHFYILMKIKTIELKSLLEGKKTYPSWSTDSTYFLECKEIGKNKIVVYYTTKNNKTFSRIFPKEIVMTPKLACILGLIKGEGANALGKSNYRRFTFTNSDSELVRHVIKMLHEAELFSKQDIKNNSFYIMHFKKEQDEVIKFWSKKLNVPESKFKCVDTKEKTRDYGICHLYISDALLRRIIDLLINEVLN